MKINTGEMYSYSTLPVDEPFTAEQRRVLDSRDLGQMRRFLIESPVDGPFTAAEAVEIASCDFETFRLDPQADGPIEPSSFAELVVEYSRHKARGC